MSAAPASAASLDRTVDPLHDRDEPAQADGDRVRGSHWVGIVVRQLEPWEDEQPVRSQRALGLTVDLGEIVGMVLGRDPPRVAVRRVVGDAENVEALEPVEVDEPTDAEHPVAPGRVRVQLGQERRQIAIAPCSYCRQRREYRAKKWSISREDLDLAVARLEEAIGRVGEQAGADRAEQEPTVRLL